MRDWVQKRVVVVGNGPSALEHDRAIDEYDWVVRFNNFRTEGYESKVGTRTDTWVSCFWQVEWRNPAQFKEIVLPVNARNPSPGWIRAWTEMREKCPAEGCRTTRVSRHTVEFLNSKGIWQGSAGIVTLAMYLEWLPKVWICGFDGFKGPQHHYFNDHSRPENCPHNGNREIELVNDWLKRGRLEMA